MNVLFLNRSFHPDLEATGQFLTELCEDLISYGHNVTVICGKSYHVAKSKRTIFLERENYNSINILRVGQTRFSKSFLPLRFINLGTYFLNAFIAGFFVKDKPDVVVAQTDPPVMGILGYFFLKYIRLNLYMLAKIFILRLVL